jgi:hypothetical protein
MTNDGHAFQEEIRAFPGKSSKDMGTGRTERDFDWNIPVILQDCRKW